MEVSMADRDNEDFIEDAALVPAELVHANLPSLEDIYGISEVLPRIGEEYQAKVPAMMTDYLQLRQRWTDMENQSLVDDFLCMQLTVPLMWVHDKSDNTKDQLTVCAVPLIGLPHCDDTKECKDDVKGSTLMQISDHDLHLGGYLKSCSSGSVSKFPYKNPKLEAGLDHSANGVGEGPSSDEFKAPFKQIDDLLMWSKENSSADEIHGGKHSTRLKFLDLEWHLVPGAHGESWSELERESFLLGLYIFGKNLVQIQKFMETKHMGDILSFYYGKFFKSDGHKKWSECRKTRSKRCIHGHQIFNGPRQQELLIRLMPHVSEESKDSLLEKTRAYNEGKVTLEEYVALIRTTVGLGKLVEAVGLGKGKQDLTGIIAESARSNQPIVARTEIPVGKACSSLTSEEMIKFLTGGFRLSKARSNDLFWEAVWPRLLARGWHSEQPKSNGYVNSKHSLVFLIPGIRKFSRRKLVKGTHYFDSLSDVLNQVVLEPGLLEIEADGTKGSREADSKLDERALSDHQPHCYLRPRISNTISESIKFTVVDTSMAYEEPYKVRDMRTLPVDSGGDNPVSLSTDTNDDSCEELVDESLSAVQMIDVKASPTKCGDMSEKSVSCQMQSLDCQLAFSAQTSLRDETATAKIFARNLERGPVAMASRKKDHESYRTRSGSQNKCPSPASKQRRTTSGDHGDSHREDHLLSTGPKVKDEEPSLEPFKVSIPETRTTFHTQESEIPYTSFGGRWETSSEKACLESLDCRKPEEKASSLCQEKGSGRPLIDLNLPHCPTDVEMDDAFDMGGVYYQDNHNDKIISFPVETSQETGSSQAFEPSDSNVGALESAMHGRRQSTRNRPLTVRALEALACGLWSSTKSTGRGTKSGESDNLTSRSRRRRMKDTRIPSQTNSLDAANVTGVIMAPKEERMDKEGSPNKIKNHIHSDKGITLEPIGLSNSSYLSEISTGKDSQSG